MRLMITLVLLFASKGLFANNIEAFLEGLTSLRADFEQTIENSQGISQIQSGTFYMQRPNQFRWDYHGEDSQLIVADGKRVWLLDRELEQVSHRSQKKALAGTPVQLLAEDGDVKTYFIILEEFKRDGLKWSRLQPKDKDSEIQEVLLAFKGNLLVYLETFDHLEQKSRFKFSTVMRNPSLQSSLFKFKAPGEFDIFQH